MTRTREFSDKNWVWGRHAVVELLRTNPGQVEQVVWAAGMEERFRLEIEDLCRRNRIPSASLAPKKFEQVIEASAHQSLAARLKVEYPYASLEDLLDQAPSSADPPPMVLALDHLQDPHNLGAIIRTAYGAGVSGVIIPRDRSCPITGTVRKAAAGALELLRVVQVTNLPRTLDRLKDQGFWILSLEASGPADFYRLDLKVPLVVVIGGEGKGVSPLMLKKSDWVASLPMAGKLTSLNASVACGVVLFEILRQRKNP